MATNRNEYDTITWRDALFIFIGVAFGMIFILYHPIPEGASKVAGVILAVMAAALIALQWRLISWLYGWGHNLTVRIIQRIVHGPAK